MLLVAFLFIDAGVPIPELSLLKGLKSNSKVPRPSLLSGLCLAFSKPDAFMIEVFKLETGFDMGVHLRKFWISISAFLPNSELSSRKFLEFSLLFCLSESAKLARCTEIGLKFGS